VGRTRVDSLPDTFARGREATPAASRQASPNEPRLRHHGRTDTTGLDSYVGPTRCFAAQGRAASACPLWLNRRNWNPGRTPTLGSRRTSDCPGPGPRRSRLQRAGPSTRGVQHATIDLTRAARHRLAGDEPAARAPGVASKAPADLHPLPSPAPDSVPRSLASCAGMPWRGPSGSPAGAPAVALRRRPVALWRGAPALSVPGCSSAG